MTPEDYHTLFNLLRKFQIHNTIVDSKLYHSCEHLLDELWSYHFNQHKEQER